MGLSWALISESPQWIALAGAGIAAGACGAQRHLSGLLTGLLTAGGTAAAIGGLAKWAASQPEWAGIAGVLCLAATPGAMLADMTITGEGRRNGPVTGAAAGILIGAALGGMGGAGAAQALMTMAAVAALAGMIHWAHKPIAAGWTAGIAATAVVWVAIDTATGRWLSQESATLMGGFGLFGFGGVVMTCCVDWAHEKRDRRRADA